MNKRLFALEAALVALMAAGCGKESASPDSSATEESEEGLADVTFVLTDTKTALSGMSIMWDGTEKVSVYDGKGNRRFTVSSSGSSATISGKAAYRSSYQLLYPYDASATFSSSGVEAYLPERQSPVARGFDPESNLLCAVSGAGSLTMRNICGLLGFTISGTDVRAVQFVSSGGECFAGHLDVTMSSTQAPGVTSADGSSATAIPADGETFAPGTYYLNLAPVVMASGVTVRLAKTDGTLQEQKRTAPLTVTRNRITLISTPVDEGDFTVLSHSSGGYAVSGGHPRLFADEAAFRRHKEAVLSQKSRILTLMHNEVIATAVRCVNRADRMSNALDASGRRMLSMARDAFGRIFMCAYAYRFTGEQRFLDCAEDLLNQICDFPDWNKQNHYLDTSTLTQAAAVGYDWLYDALSPETRAKVEQKVFEYSLSGALNDAASYLRPSSGWNATVTSGLILGAIAFSDINPSLCAQLLDTAIPSNWEGLRQLLGTDGSDYMGTMYWRNFVQIEMLSVSALQSAFLTDFGTSDYAGYRNTPKWYLHLIGPTGRTFAFGDNNASVDTVPAMLYFSVLFGDPSLPYFELKEAEKGNVLTGGVRVDGGDAIGMRTYPLVLLWASKYEPSEYRLPEDNVNVATSGVQPVVTARTGWGDDDLYLAVKGGRANVGHGHMDAGSFCFDGWGERWATDFVQDDYDILEAAIAKLGAGSLWDNTDGSARYQCFRINARQHNTLTVNDTDHLVSGAGVFVSTDKSEMSMGATVDLTAVLAGQVGKATRTALIKDKSYLSVTDHIEALPDKEAAIRWNLSTEAVPEITDEGIKLTIGSKSVLMQASSSYAVTYRIFTSDPKEADHPAPFCDSEEVRDGEHYCGFTVTVPAGQTDDITVTFKKI